MLHTQLNRRRLRRAICAGAFVSALLLALAVPPSPAMSAETYKPDAALLAAAQKDKEVIWYTTLIVNQIVRPAIAAFEKQVPGVKVSFVRGNSTQLTTRLLTEFQAGNVQSDVWNLTDGIAALAQAKAIAPFEIPNSAELPPDFRDAGKMWVATNLSTRSVAYNTDLIADKDAPRSYADLLAPRFKGKMVWNPTSLSGGVGFIGTVLKHMGEDKGMAYLRALAGQTITPVPTSDRAVLDRVIAGEYAVGLEMTSSHAVASRKQDAAIRWVPVSPVTTTLQLAGVVAKAPHPAAARLFLDFLVSRAGQTVFRDHGYLPVHPKIAPADPMLRPQEGGYQAIVLSPDDVEQHAREWLEIYQDVFR